MSTLPLSADVPGPLTANATVPTAQARSLGIDAVRFLAIAGIVWRHAADTTSDAVGFFGVPFFLIVSLLLLGRSLGGRADESVGALIRHRVVRLYVPFLAWCVIYAGLQQAKAIRHGELNLDPFTGWILLGGTQRHLWFLPFLLIAMLVAIPLLTWAKASVTRASSVAMATTLLAFAVIAAPMPSALREPLHPDHEFLLSYYQAVPSALIGLALAAVLGLPRRAIRWRNAIGIAGVLILAATIAGDWHRAEPTLPLSTIGGLAALLIAGAPLAGAAPLAWLGRLSFGIYLSHVVFLRVIAQLAEAKNIAPGPTLDAAAFVVALVGSALLTLALRQSKYTRWLIGD